MQRTRDSSGSKRRFEPWNSSNPFIQRNSQAPGAAHSTRVSRGTKSAHSSRAIIDATRPYEWLKDFPLASAASAELKQKVVEKYGKYFQ